jgi:hypothetical protein
LSYARLRVECQRIGHPLAQRSHDAGRWVVWLGIALVSNGGIFASVPGLMVESAAR